MEMLQAKQEQEKKRIRGQMEAEAAVQRQQMENMVKARMMEAEKHRPNFMQENQVLSQRLAQMRQKLRQKVTFGIYAELFHSDILRNSFSVLIGKKTE